MAGALAVVPACALACALPPHTPELQARPAPLFVLHLRKTVKGVFRTSTFCVATSTSTSAPGAGTYRRLSTKATMGHCSRTTATSPRHPKSSELGSGEFLLRAFLLSVVFSLFAGGGDVREGEQTGRLSAAERACQCGVQSHLCGDWQIYVGASRPAYMRVVAVMGARVKGCGRGRLWSAVDVGVCAQEREPPRTQEAKWRLRVRDSPIGVNLLSHNGEREWVRRVPDEENDQAKLGEPGNRVQGRLSF
ncbi:hypothetical protein B0H14DRAFT_3144350 [Mycena olivaceomarginata]|nr:hypothetical protein B0H14DRAFT_3144350 [Mycena olivaceomarginata]